MISLLSAASASISSDHCEAVRFLPLLHVLVSCFYALSAYAVRLPFPRTTYFTSDGFYFRFVKVQQQQSKVNFFLVYLQ